GLPCAPKASQSICPPGIQFHLFSSFEAMKPTSDPWKKLTTRAREAPALAESMPYGFATRVVAQWRALPQEDLQEIWQRLTYRGLAIAAAILMAFLAYGYQSVSNVGSGDTVVAQSWLENLLSL